MGDLKCPYCEHEFYAADPGFLFRADRAGISYGAGCPACHRWEIGNSKDGAVVKWLFYGYRAPRRGPLSLPDESLEKLMRRVHWLVSRAGRGAFSAA